MFFVMIKNWVAQCHEQHCFCPEDCDKPLDYASNIKCYISSPGNDAGNVNDARGSRWALFHSLFPNSKNIVYIKNKKNAFLRRILRLPMERNQRPIEHSVGDLIVNVFGAELAQFCHFGKESSIVHLLMKSLMSTEIDLRPLLGGAPIYDTKKHIRKLGLSRTLPGLSNCAHSKPDKFIKGFVWKSASTAVMSEGIGVNMWAILLMASLMGSDEIHCKSSSRVATSVLSLILGLAPSAATPGNRIPVRSFNERSREPELVVVPSRNRCEHFLRPIEDDNLAMNGNYTYCQIDGKFVPEDYLGCAYVLEMSKFLKCKYEEVPPKHMLGYYQLMPGRYYHIYRHPVEGVSKAEGMLFIDSHGVHVEYDDGQGPTATSFTFLDWHAQLKERGFLVMPSVWRCGAAVLTGPDLDVVGCLVPTGTRRAMEENDIEFDEADYIANYDHLNFCYHALVEEDTLTQLSVVDTFSNLVVPGTILWLKSGSPTWEQFKDQFPRAPQLSDEDKAKRVVQVRLNIPVDQVEFNMLASTFKKCIYVYSCKKKRRIPSLDACT